MLLERLDVVAQLRQGAQRGTHLPRQLLPGQLLVIGKHQLLALQAAGQRLITDEFLLCAQFLAFQALRFNLQSERRTLAEQPFEPGPRRRQVGDQQRQHAVDIPARTGFEDVDGLARQRAAFSAFNEDLVGQHIAARRVAEHDDARDDQAALGAIDGDAGAGRDQHRAGGQAIDDDVAGLVADPSADDVAPERNRAAVRKNRSEDVRMRRDAAALDRPLFLNLAEFLELLASQREIAGGADADAFAIDNLVGDRELMRQRIDVQKPAQRRDQLFAALVRDDARPGPAQRRQVEVLGQGRQQRLAGNGPAIDTEHTRNLSDQAFASGDLRITVLELAQVDASVGELPWRVVAAQARRLFPDFGIAPRFERAWPGHHQALVDLVLDRRRQGQVVESETNAVLPGDGDEFVGIEARRNRHRFLDDANDAEAPAVELAKHLFFNHRLEKNGLELVLRLAVLDLQHLVECPPLRPEGDDIGGQAKRLAVLRRRHSALVEQREEARIVKRTEKGAG